MPLPLPTSPEELAALPWRDIELRYRLLVRRNITAASVAAWLADWSRLSEVVDEQNNLLAVAVTTNTADREADRRYQEHIDRVITPSRRYEQKLREKLLASGLTPAGMEIPLRAMRAEAALYRESNLPLLAEEQKLCNEYDDITGAQTVQWNGEELTFTEIQKILVEENDRSMRERAWLAMRERLMADKPAIHGLWRKLFSTRQQIAANADKPDYRAYAWDQGCRFDYSPRDCKIFHTSVEKVVVPAASRIYERRRQTMGIESVRPWDEYVDPLARPALRPFRRITQLTGGVEKIFMRLDPVLGGYFHVMRAENLLDLKSRKNKAEDAYCTFFELAHKPFILMNAVGLHYDVQTLIHESGHAFHSMEAARLPYLMQREAPMEFNEVASLAMELLAAPYLIDSGLYTPAEAARARIETLEDIILAWPYIALVDAFQHWMYEFPLRGADPRKCDAKWTKLIERFIPGVNYEGIEPYLPTHWHHQSHILQSPFYYIEYGLAQLGAVQVWANALKDQPAAVEAYRRALALGATVPLPELYAAAGAKLAFDRKTLQSAIHLIESQIAELEKVVGQEGAGQIVNSPETAGQESASAPDGRKTLVRVLIQTAGGSSGRRLYDERTLEHKTTRELHPPSPSPYPYGFILGTRSDEGDCVDCYIITHESLEAGSIVECEPVGLLEQHEGEKIEYKILAILAGGNIELNQDGVERLHAFIYAISANFPGVIKVGDLLPREQALEYLQKHLET